MACASAAADGDFLLLAVGLKAAAGKKRLSFGGALFAVLLPWGLVVLISASFAGMMG